MPVQPFMLSLAAALIFLSPALPALCGKEVPNEPHASPAFFTALIDPAMPRTLAAVRSLDSPKISVEIISGSSADPILSLLEKALDSGRGVLLFSPEPVEHGNESKGRPNAANRPSQKGVPLLRDGSFRLCGDGIFEPLGGKEDPNDDPGRNLEQPRDPESKPAGTLAIIPADAMESPSPVLAAKAAIFTPGSPHPGVRIVIFTRAMESLPDQVLARTTKAAAAFLADSKTPEAEQPGTLLAKAAKALATAGDPATPKEIAEWVRLSTERDREARKLLREILGSIHGEDTELLDGVFETLRDQGGRIMVREGAPLDTSNLSDLEIRSLGNPGAGAIAEILAKAAGGGGVETADAPAGPREAAKKQAAEAQTAIAGTDAGATGGIESSGDDGDEARFADGSSSVNLNGLTDWIDPYPKVRNGAIAGLIRLVSGGSPPVPVRVQATGDGVARYTRSREDGSFFISEVPIGEYNVVYMAPGHAPAITGEALYGKAWVGNGETYVMPDMVIKTLPALIPGNGHGKVVNMASGDLMSGVAISVRDHYVLSDSEGSFSIPGLAPGPASIMAMASGYRTYVASIVIVPGAEVSHTVIMEPVEAGAAGIIETDGWGHLLDWSTVVVMVKGVPHDTIKVENGTFTVKVPALMPQYVVMARAPYCEPAEVTVPGPLYPGGTLGVSGLILRRRTAPVSFKLFTGTACEGTVYVVISGMGTFGPSSNFGGGFEAGVGPVTMPQGPSTFGTMGAGGLRPAQRDAEKFEIVVTGYTGEISLYLPK